MSLEVMPCEGPVRNIDEVADVLMAWITDAVAWEMATASERLPAGVSKPAGLQVLLHVYDVSQEGSIKVLNQIFAFESSPLKLGGVFHAGVEVNGVEWSFECQPFEGAPGVSCGAPRRHGLHHYRETVVLEPTHLSPDGIAYVIAQLVKEYPGTGYNVVHRNCCHFAQDLAERLGCGDLPAWVNRFAGIGAQVDTVFQAAQAWRDRMTFASSRPAPSARSICQQETRALAGGRRRHSDVGCRPVGASGARI